MAQAGWAFAGLTRFSARDGAPVAGGTGPALTAAGSVALAQGDDHVRQSILILLGTRPGERVMRPDYGCPVHRLLFEPNDATTAGLAVHYVRQALLRFQPQIDIIRLDAGPKAFPPSLMTIELDYRVRETMRAERLVFDVDLSGEAA